jgi:pyruvate formate lyase activating enzyme
MSPPLEPHETAHPGRHFTRLDDGRVRCDICPRRCEMKPGQRGFCFVRQGTDDGVALTTYGRSSGFCVDPIEKKPLNHFLPGTSVLSFGTAGCNLGCKFCQNWDISKAREMDRLQDTASPEAIAAAAADVGCASVAFTYNDPVIFFEYALDAAAACKERGVKTVAVTAGYITDEARPEFYAGMDAANIDLKAFDEDFYWKLCSAHLEPVKETLRWVVHNSDTWVEITTLLIPDANDSNAEIDAMTQWIASELGTHVPLHFSAFHPDYKMTDRGSTPAATLLRARDIARNNGLRFVYTGNVHDAEGGSTWCPSCGERLIERDWYNIGAYKLDGDACGRCGEHIEGVFAADGLPKRPWGRKRLPVRIG